jgi:hypothetical protein
MIDRITQGLLAAAVALLAANCISHGPPAASAQTEVGGTAEVLRAQRIELVDPAGQVRVHLKVEQSGEVVFRMLDAKGTIRVKLAASEDGAGLLILDDHTEPALHLLSKSSSTTLTLVEHGKQPHVLQP